MAEILRQRIGWTRQWPARRAVEHADAAIEAWVKRPGQGPQRGSTTRRLDQHVARPHTTPS
ncbi:hypothetical protein [Dactylosporangium salmoneum]|uniref:hypothetical protein n=1 Tax=Dactylosporangium salmoneum TaxID=53361 RepID=UPI003CD0770F